jgi:hypothetical protein
MYWLTFALNSIRSLSRSARALVSPHGNPICILQCTVAKNSFSPTNCQIQPDSSETTNLSAMDSDITNMDSAASFVHHSLGICSKSHHVVCSLRLNWQPQIILSAPGGGQRYGPLPTKPYSAWPQMMPQAVDYPLQSPTFLCRNPQAGHS